MEGNNARFCPVDMDTWGRKPWFDYYYGRIKCRYNLGAEVDITPLLGKIKEEGFRFYPVMVYAVVRAVNANQEFRMAFDTEGRLGYWDRVNPSYTIFHDDDKTFSDIWTEYSDCFPEFYRNAVADMEKYRDVKGVQAKPDKPANFCPVSAIPWLSFTGFAQDTYGESDFLFPLVRFGKYFMRDEKVLLPLSVFVHHAVADGYHTSKLINDIEHLAQTPDEWMK